MFLGKSHELALELGGLEVVGAGECAEGRGNLVTIGTFLFFEGGPGAFDLGQEGQYSALQRPVTACRLFTFSPVFPDK